LVRAVDVAFTPGFKHDMTAIGVEGKGLRYPNQEARKLFMGQRLLPRTYFSFDEDRQLARIYEEKKN
jgi:hypothetical protein